MSSWDQRVLVHIFPDFVLNIEKLCKFFPLHSASKRMFKVSKCLRLSKTTIPVQSSYTANLTFLGANKWSWEKNPRHCKLKMSVSAILSVWLCSSPSLVILFVDGREQKVHFVAWLRKSGEKMSPSFQNTDKTRERLVLFAFKPSSSVYSAINCDRSREMLHFQINRKEGDG